MVTVIKKLKSGYINGTRYVLIRFTLCYAFVHLRRQIRKHFMLKEYLRGLLFDLHVVTPFGRSSYIVRSLYMVRQFATG